MSRVRGARILHASHCLCDTQNSLKRSHTIQYNASFVLMAHKNTKHKDRPLVMQASNTKTGYDKVAEL